MKRTISAIFIGVVAILLLASCESDTVTKIMETPSLSLSTSSVTLPSSATSYNISYSIVNPADNGNVSLTSSASWVTNLDASTSGQLSFYVETNTSSDLRTATLTLTYTYDGGTASAKVAVVQYGAGEPFLSLDPNSIVADGLGGTYSFYYSIENGSTEGEISCEANVSWLSDFDYSSNGMVSFDVEASEEDEIRSGVITVTYGDLETEMTVIQDFPEKWNLYGTGRFDYYLYFIGDDTGLELYQSQSNPNRFKLEHWLYDVDFIFTWNQDTNRLNVESGQYSGYDDPTYGSVYLSDFTDDRPILEYYGASPGYYQDGMFYFALEYYCSYGVFCYGYETFILDTATAYVPTVENFVGTYNVLELSTFNTALYIAEWEVKESDNETKGNIMLTEYDGIKCEEDSIYGTLDADKRLVTIEPMQYFADWYSETEEISYKLYFDTYFETDASIMLLNNGDFWGICWGDLLATYMYYDDDNLYWWDAYEYSYGGKDIVIPTSASPNSVSGSLSVGERSLDKVKPVSIDTRFNRLPTPKVQIDCNK